MAGVGLSPRPATQACRPRGCGYLGAVRRCQPPGSLALHPGAESAGAAPDQAVRAAARPAGLGRAGRRGGRRLPDLQGRAAGRTGNLCHLSGNQGSAAVDLGAVPPVALCQALQGLAAAGLPADAGLHRRHAGAALHDHAADGQRADPVPERHPHRYPPGHALPVGPAGRGAAGLGTGLGAYLHPGAGVRAHRPAT